MLDIKELQAESRDLIANGEIEQSISLLMKFTKNKKPNFYNELIILSNKLNSMKRNKRLNLLPNEVLSLEESKITHSTLEIIDDLEFDRPNVKKYSRIWGYVSLFFRASKSILSFYLIFISLIIFFYRRDILYRLVFLNTKAPVQDLFFPIFLLIIGFYLLIIKPKHHEN